MTKIAILTETSADLTPRQKEYKCIFQIPLYIIMDGKAYKEEEDISSADYYRQIDQMDEIPKTSQATPYDFKEKFESIFEQNYDHIIVITLSKKLSGTYQSACLAAEDYPEQVSVFPSQTGSVGEGLLVEAAGRMVEAHYSLEEILRELDRLDQAGQLSAALVSIENLVKGGRVPKMAGRLQSFLGLKFAFNLKNGQLHFLKHSRRLNRVLEAMENDFENWYQQQNGPCQVALFHVNDPEQGQKFLKAFKDKFPEVPVELQALGPVIGTHASTGALGMAAIPLVEYEK